MSGVTPTQAPAEPRPSNSPSVETSKAPHPPVHSVQEVKDDIAEKNSGEEFILERYKYILQQIHTLNESHQKYLNLYQSLTVAIVGGIIAIFAGWKSLQLTTEIPVIGIRGLETLLIILSGFVIVSILSSIAAWQDYRKEEVELLDIIVRPGFRKPPKLRNFWYWQETYFVVGVIISAVTICAYVELFLIPNIR
jgi:hypothetical protein